MTRGTLALVAWSVRATCRAPGAAVLRSLLLLAAILLAFTTGAYAGGVDWSNYIEKPGESRQLVKTTPEPKRSEPASAKRAPTAKKTKAKRVARPAKAKTSKAKAKKR